VIGTTTPLAGAFTTLTASSTATLNTLVSSGATLTGGTINGMTVGATTASTGVFTTVNTSGIITITIPGTGVPTNLAVNTTAGAANGMSIEVRADESQGIRLVQTSTTYNTAPVNPDSPPNIASAGTLVSGRGGGLNIVGANGPVRTYSGGASTATTSVSSTGLAVTGTLSATTTIRTSDGVVATPTFSFTNETGTGLYRSTNGAMSVAVLGAEVSRFTTSGLAITGTLSATGNISATGGGFFSTKASGTSPVLELTQTGVYTWDLINTATTGLFSIRGNTTPFLSIASATGAVTIPQTLGVTGNVGIGTASPRLKLDVSTGTTQNSDAVVIGPTSGTAVVGDKIRLGFALQNTAGGSTGNTYAAAIGGIQDKASSNSGALGFYTQTSAGDGTPERARITSSGDLLVGVISTVSTIINGNSEGGFAVQGKQTNGGASVVGFFNAEASSGDNSPVLGLSKAMTTTSSTARFVQFFAGGVSTTPMGGIVGNGASNVQFATLSDAREKTNIQPMSGSLDKISALKPVAFDWIKSGEHVNSGFIAQDVEVVFPEFVVDNMSNEGEEVRKGLTGGMTGGIIPHLVKAIQEQQALITQLTARITALETP